MSDAVVGTEVDGYRIQSVLGRGGMGTVYKAEDVNLSRTVAIKRINPGQQERESFIHRFRSEAQALARIDSSNIVGVYALRETDIGLLIVMEYVEGGTLKDPLESQGAIAPSQAIPILEQTLEAFHDAHSAGVIHRDIKPENIMLTKDGMVKVTDFGIAKLRQPDSGETVTQGGQGGTLKYMSPEQISNISAVDARSDIYSLGMTAYEILSGSLPFKESDTDFDIMRKVVEGEIPPPDEFNTDIPSGLAQWVMGAVQKQQDDRYQTVEEMLEALREADRQSEHTVTQPEWEVGSGEADEGETQTVSPDDLDDTDEDRTQTVVPGGDSDDTEPSDPGGETVMGDGPMDAGGATQPAVPDPESTESEVETTGEAQESAASDTEATPESDRAPSRAADAPEQEESGVSWAVVGGGIVALLVLAVGGYVMGTQMGGGGTAKPSATLSLATAPTGATVLVNGDTAGTTPVSGYTFDAGVAQLEIRKSGFTPVDTTLTADAGAQISLQGVQLNRPAQAAASEEQDETANAPAADAPDASAASGGRTSASSDPAASAAPAEEQTTSASTSSEPTSTQTQDVAASTAEPAPEDAPRESPMGTVSISAKPSGMVFIDGEQKSGSRIEVPVGEHTVTCEHPDRGAVETTIKVEEGQSETLTCYFEQKVSVNTTGAYGRIWLNGSNTGKNTNAASPLSLPPGEHRIEVRRRSIDNFQVSGGMVKIRRGDESQTKDFSGNAYRVQVEPTFEEVEHAIVFNVSTP
jgi:serine/threonine protein kinase